MPRHNEDSLGRRSQVYEKHIGITQVACMRTAWDAHKPHAWESHTMCPCHVHENRMGHARGQQHEERFSIFSKHVLHRKEFIQEHPNLGKCMLFSKSMFSMVSILVFEYLVSIVVDLESLGQIFMHLLRSKAWEQSNPRFPTSPSYCTVWIVNLERILSLCQN